MSAQYTNGLSKGDFYLKVPLSFVGRAKQQEDSRPRMGLHKRVTSLTLSDGGNSAELNQKERTYSTRNSPISSTRVDHSKLNFAVFSAQQRRPKSSTGPSVLLGTSFQRLTTASSLVDLRKAPKKAGEKLLKDKKDFRSSDNISKFAKTCPSMMFKTFNLPKRFVSRFADSLAFGASGHRNPSPKFDVLRSGLASQKPPTFGPSSPKIKFIKPPTGPENGFSQSTPLTRQKKVRSLSQPRLLSEPKDAWSPFYSAPPAIHQRKISEGKKSRTFSVKSLDIELIKNSKHLDDSKKMELILGSFATFKPETRSQNRQNICPNLPEDERSLKGFATELEEIPEDEGEDEEWDGTMRGTLLRRSMSEKISICSVDQILTIRELSFDLTIQCKNLNGSTSTFII